MLHEIPVLFHSSGVPLAGLLYRDTEDMTAVQPGLVVTGSWLTVKEQMPALYARRLAAHGYTVLVFDFAGFGQSGGEPRQAEIPARKIGDISAAARFLRSLSLVKPDGLGHLAICASAQYTLAAIAEGAPITAFTSVAGWFHDPPSLASFYGGRAGIARRIGLAQKAVRHYVADGRLEVVAAYRPGDEEAGMFFELDYYANPSRGAVSAWKNEMATMSWLYWLTFDGLRAASQVSVPTLLVHSEGCVLPENVRAIHQRLKGEKNLVWTYNSHGYRSSPKDEARDSNCW